MSVETEFAVENFFRVTHQANRARVLAHLLAPRIQELFPHLFTKPPEITALNGQGWSNLTVKVRDEISEHGYILRLFPREKEGGGGSRSALHYEKEWYVLDRLKGHDFVPLTVRQGTGVLTLNLPGRGDIEFAYALQHRLPFVAARQLEHTLDRERCLEQLGAITQAIHAVSVHGYGSDFDESSQSFRHGAFSDLVKHKIAVIEDSSLAFAMKRWLTARTEHLFALTTGPQLYHRDLLGNWGNFLVDSAGNVRGIIDWEFAGAGAPLHVELASMIYVLNRDAAPSDQIERDLCAVLRGYGLSRDYYRAHYERDVETLVLLNSVSALNKLQVLERSGGLTREPWRKRFAERATALCERCFSTDRAA